MVPLGERRAGLSSTCLNTGCETCALARGCEQLLLSFIFRFCCLALPSSVFLLPIVRNVGAGEEY